MVETIDTQRRVLENLARGAKDGTYYPCKADLPGCDWVVQRLAGLCVQSARKRAEATKSAKLYLFEVFRPKPPLSFCTDYVRESERPVPI